MEGLQALTLMPDYTTKNADQATVGRSSLPCRPNLRRHTSTL